MKKIFILSMLLILSCGYAYGGEIIMLTNNNLAESTPVLTEQGNVYWIRLQGHVAPITYTLCYYDGTEVKEVTNRVGEFNWGADATSDTVSGNSVVYDKPDGTPTNDKEIYLFDGTKEIQITNNNFDDCRPVIKNGYIAWQSCNPNYPPCNCDDGNDQRVEISLYKPDQPTAVNMSALKATPANKQIKVEWQTEAEIDNAGFNVWRAEGFQKVNQNMISAEGSPIMGADYDFFDKWVMNGKLYYYLIEDIDNSGISTFHGPVKATPRWIFGIGN